MEELKTLLQFDHLSLFFISIILFFSVLLVYRKPLGQIFGLLSKLIIKRLDSKETISVVQIQTGSLPGARFIQEHVTSIQFINSLRVRDSEKFYDFLFSLVSEVRARLGNPYPNVRLTFSLSNVDYISSAAVSALSRILIDVAQKNGIFLNINFPKDRFKNHVTNFQILAGAAEHVSISTDHGGC
ncbi:hypothetical protein [Leptospira santarosai]|uniref:STAS domain-containing protein n=1 Tax=Leptospira santarosai serovar Arenal str. MAVJ 401 TaxID=1049976 RepID=M6JKN5_9LEPT|nr:hypothetical protein [Leptospira santarosai]EMM76983.1 hypothetical protein LEP1GSC040_0067 [Leptospira santarosai str. 2000030832]EMN20120.1 hypothetical protein LEP1GSC063_2682 [Leptospira santarosai serovar Arenal str. MAVJ 401]